MTPMMTQYLEIKNKHKDCIVMFRLGDFYEMFFDDAVTASRALDLVLTARDCGEPQKAPMCGVPHHSAENYISKLVACGHKVAICEQMTEPNAKTIVERDVVRIVTAGTNLENLSDNTNNFLASIFYDNKTAGLSWCDLSTGEFFVQEFNKNAITKTLEKLVQINPQEIICSNAMFVQSSALPPNYAAVLPKFSSYYEWAFKFENSKDRLKTQLKVNSLDSFGISKMIAGINAAGALVEYLAETQKRTLNHINKIMPVDEGLYMSVDQTSRRSLEIMTNMRENTRKGSLVDLLDKTATTMGARLLVNWVQQPLTHLGRIQERLDGIEELVDNYILRQAINDILKEIKDIHRISSKMSCGNVQPRDFLALSSSLSVLPRLKYVLSQSKSKILKNINALLSEFDKLTELIDSAIDSNAATLKDKGYIKAGYNDELDRLNKLSRNGKAYVAELESKEKERTGIKSLKIGYNKIFGYYIEVTKSYLNLVPMEYIRKQTVANAERYVTEQLKELEESILNAEEQSEKLEKSLFAELVQNTIEYITEMQTTSAAIAALDCLFSFATVAVTNNYTKPAFSNDGSIKIVGGRHPVVEKVLSKEQFIPNDTILDTNLHRTMIITGPNMAGKSTYMRQVALITYMAHLGCFVPAESATLSICDKLFTRIGASDDLSSNQSTFMMEMNETANILNNATRDSLLILDEIGRGTSTFDGLAIAWSIMEYISTKIKCKTLFSTHFHEITELEDRIEGVKNYRISVTEADDTIVFLHKIERGCAHKSFGIEVASLAGLPDRVLVRARKLLNELEEADITKQQVSMSNVISNKYQEFLDTIDYDNCTHEQAISILKKLKSI